jgi:thymidylate synthase
MEHTESGYLNNDFRTCLYRLMTYGLEAHPRETTTREILNYNITLRDPRNRVITFPGRRTSTKYLLGEFIWYLRGLEDPAGILPYAKFWDGIRNTGENQYYQKGTVNSNYGTRLFGHSTLPAFTRQASAFSVPMAIHQWNETAALLQKDKDSRQAIMNIHVPSDRHAGNLDVPCTLTLQWFIRENKLHLIVNMRSNDVILGFTNDVFQFTMLQEAMMLQLRAAYPNLGLGYYYHNAGSMHIYDRHFQMAHDIVNTPNAVDISMIPMDRFDDQILTGLVGVEAAWQSAGAPGGFDFRSVPAFDLLTPYWQHLVKGFFLQDEESLHLIFGDPDHE